MDIRSSLDGLKSLLGTTATDQAGAPSRSGANQTVSSAWANDKASLSSAASEVSSTAGDTDVRASKVAEISAALASGTYNVPASAVASRMVDAMLAASR